MAITKGFISIVIALLYLVCIPVVCGRILSGRKHSPAAAYVTGMLLMGAAFQASAVPLILLHRSLRAVLIVWHALLIAVTAGTMLLRRRKGTEAVKESGSLQRPGRVDALLGLIAAVLLLVQCAFYVFGTHIDDDDARYVANAVEAYETGTMYRHHPNTGEEMTYFMGEISKEVVSPITMFYAGVSVLTGIHPAVMMHTVWPVVWLCMGYLSLWLVSGALFGEDRTRRLFFLIVCMCMVLWGNTAVRRGEVFMLTRLWQGKSLIPAIISPLFFDRYLRGYDQKTGYYGSLFLVSLFACLSSGMGIVMAAVYTGLITLLHAIRERRPLILFGGMLCALPNVCYAVIYLLLVHVKLT